MQLITLDFETYYSKDYSLSKLSYEEYINDEQFETIGVGVAKGMEAPVFLLEDTFKQWAAQIDWSQVALLCHNTQFDAAVLSWRYGIRPRLYMDTLSMARAVHGIEVGNSLAKLVEYYELGKKGTEVVQAMGKRLADFSPEELRAYAGYCKNDVTLTRDLFFTLKEIFPASEMQLISQHIQMFVEPRLKLDTDVLQAAYDKDEQQLANLLTRLNVSLKDLGSNDKFAALLEMLGAQPQKKTSRTTKKKIWAFAKTDVAFQELLNSSDPNISLLCEARLAAKSTQTRTRTRSLLEISRRNEYLPIPLSYWAAQTGRTQATRGQKINMQNMRRGSSLRAAIVAPDGYVLGVADLSQIEPRVLAWLAGDQRMLGVLRESDPYATFGADMFGVPGMTKESHPALRQSAKSALLGCGYGLGHISFATQLLAGFMGAPSVRYDMPFLAQLGVGVDEVWSAAQDTEWVEKVMQIPHSCRPIELVIHAYAAKILIDKYRTTAHPVRSLWRTANEWINHMISGSVRAYKNITIEHEKILLPNGMYMRYPGIRKIMDEEERPGEIYTVYGKRNTKIYGAKLCLAGDTQILTDKGWKRLDAYTPEDLLWDGVQWVHGEKLVDQGFKPVINYQGAFMTADHEVLNEKGYWEEASQFPRPYRPSIWRANCALSGVLGWKKMAMELAVRVWEAVRQEGRFRNERTGTRRLPKLRMQNPAADAAKSTRIAWHARHEQASGVLGMAKHARPLPPAYAPGVAQLRSAWNNCMQKVGEVRKLLGGHGSNIPHWSFFGAQKQRSGVFSGKLLLGYEHATEQEQAQQHGYPHPLGGNDCYRSSPARRDKFNNAALQTTAQLPRKPAVRQAGFQKQVYDILNAGPRRRFTVRAEGGKPFIVHNCENLTQAIARIVMTDGMLRIAKRYPIVLTVHDEVVFLVPEAEAEEGTKWGGEQLIIEPEYMPGIPLSVDSSYAKRYVDAK